MDSNKPQPGPEPTGEQPRNPLSEQFINPARAGLLRIIVDEGARYRGQLLYDALLTFFKAEGCAAATVSRAIKGFGGSGKIQSETLVDFLPHLPVMVEVVETREKLEELRPKLEEMVEEGLIFVQEVEIWEPFRRPFLKEVPDRARVDQIMKRSVVSVHPDTPVVEVVRLLLDQDYFKALPVVDLEGKLAGIISDGDLLSRGKVPHRLGVIESYDRENFHKLMEELHHNDQKAGQIMTTSLVVVRPETPVKEATNLMITHRLSRLPVVDKHNRLVGILGRLDILKLVAASYSGNQSGDSLKSKGKMKPLIAGELALAKPQTARELMSTDVTLARPYTPFSDLVEKIVTSPYRRLVVLDEHNRIVGVVTDADLVARVGTSSRPGVLKALAHSLGLRTGEVSGDRKNAPRTTGEVMTREVIKVNQDTSLDVLVGLMLQHRVKFIPVEDAKGELLGVITRNSLLRAVAENL